MSFFGAVGDLFRFDRKQDNYAQMSRDDLLALDDETFYFALRKRVFQNTFALSECRNGTHRTYYIVMSFYTETYHEGIAQFFYNASRECAPYVSRALEEIGSIKMKNAFDELVNAAHIPLDDTDALQELEEDETADEKMMLFDEAFEDNDDVNERLVAYSRNYIDELI